MGVREDREGARGDRDSGQERRTRQRREIQDVFNQEQRPLSPKEVYDLAKVSLPSLGMATVYRTIKRLVEEELLTALDIPGVGVLYEMGDMDPHHAHFLCTTCHRVYEMDTPVSKPRKGLPRGFVLEDYEVLLKGRCPGCDEESS